MSRPLWILVTVAILILCGIVLPETLSALWADYSSMSHYLSELGAVGAPHAAIINIFGFLPVALATAILLSVIAFRQLRTNRGRIGAVLVGIGLATGYLIAVFFPCDLRCPVQGSPRQAVHNLAGLIQYPLGALGLILMGQDLKRHKGALGWLFILSGCAMAIGFVMMILPDQHGLRGFWQRLGDYSAFIVIARAATSGLRIKARKDIETA